MASRVRGAKGVSAGLKDLSRNVTQPIGTASRFALQPVLADARANVRATPFDESTGALAASLTIKKDPASRVVSQTYRVGPQADFEKNGRRPSKYAHLIEFGTAPHYQPKRGVTHPGSRAMPFLEPAYDANKEKVVKRYGEKIGPALEKRAKQIAAKSRRAK